MAEAPERDINDLFEDIVLTEERLTQKAYKEGYQEGRTQGSLEGYQLGYTQGVQLGEELGNIYGIVVAHQQFQHTGRVKRLLKQLRELIDKFPRDNDPEKDIIGTVEQVRNLYKKLQAMLGTKRAADTTSTLESGNTAAEHKDYTF